MANGWNCLRTLFLKVEEKIYFLWVQTVCRRILNFSCFSNANFLDIIVKDLIIHQFRRKVFFLKHTMFMKNELNAVKNDSRVNYWETTALRQLNLVWNKHKLRCALIRRRKSLNKIKEEHSQESFKFKWYVHKLWL